MHGLAAERTARHYIQPGRRVQNAFIESFNSKLRGGCPNRHVLLSLTRASERIDSWRRRSWLHRKGTVRPSNLRAPPPPCSIAYPGHNIDPELSS
jgi:transposase InsO family protein